MRLALVIAVAALAFAGPAGSRQGLPTLAIQIAGPASAPTAEIDGSAKVTFVEREAKTGKATFAAAIGACGDGPCTRLVVRRLGIDVLVDAADLEALRSYARKRTESSSDGETDCTIAVESEESGRSYDLTDCFPVAFSGGDFSTGGEASTEVLVVKVTRVEPS